MNYPSRTNRKNQIAEVKSGDKTTIAGRLLFSQDEVLLADESGVCELGFAEHKVALIEGTILEVTGEMKSSGKFEVEGWEILSAAPAFSSTHGEQTPNWQRVISDLQLRSVFLLHSQVLKEVREFFWSKGFDEVQTPTLVALPGMEPYINPFRTDLELENGKKFASYLITSPEYAMKKLLVAGLEKIFQITRSYRNCETLSSQHNPEFTILEWYRAYASYEEIMQDAEDLVRFVVPKITGKDFVANVDNNNQPIGSIDVSKPWEKISFQDSLKKYAEVEYAEIETLAGLKKVMEQKGYTDLDADWNTLVLQMFLNEVEPKLGQTRPTILYDYPISMAALSKRSEKDPRFAERFEVFIGGMELANAFTELNDPQEQEKRLKEERLMRRQLHKEDYQVDESFIEALRWGMPPSGGIALGIDRLVMLLVGTRNIKDVIWFPWEETFTFS
jgi:elongation factor P--(R)-beta-lysine ligase